jgi:hypothetical protein
MLKHKMIHETAAPQHTKISREFATRLAGLPPRRKIRAIVMLQAGDPATANARRRASSEREAALRSARQRVESALPDIDQVLEKFGGKRLSGEMDALGAVSVETTAAGVRGLTSLECVKAVLEDQGILTIRQ